MLAGMGQMNQLLIFEEKKGKETLINKWFFQRQK